VASDDSDILDKHIYATYFSLRLGLGLIALLFPLILWAIGAFRGVSLQPSMSDYYFAFMPQDTELREFRMRGLFVGFLFAIGSFLYLYKGVSRPENYLLNLAGILAILVALVPMETPKYCKNCGTNDYAVWHLRFAYGLFACVGVVAIFCTEKTLERIKDRDTKARFRAWYDISAVLMVLLPLGAYLATGARSPYVESQVFIVEFAGIAAFSLYWFLKTAELRTLRAQGDKAKEKNGSTSAQPETPTETPMADAAPGGRPGAERPKKDDEPQGKASGKELAQKWEEKTLGPRTVVSNFLESAADALANVPSAMRRR
jgi:hypothetical protein